MRRRKVTKKTQQTLISSQESGEMDGVGKGKGRRFVACYLLTSLSPRFKGHTYIGFTVNPRRRIRQHNGEIGSGAWRTKKKTPLGDGAVNLWLPYECCCSSDGLCLIGACCLNGHGDIQWNLSAVRSAAASFKSLSGIANKIKLAYTMLSLPAWNSLSLAINFSTKYRNHTSGCPTLPQQMRTQICTMDELPCYNGSNTGATDDLTSDDDCDLNDVLQESTQESIEAARKASDSPSSLGGFEETFLRRISEKDDTSHEFTGCSKENWIGIKNLQHSREEDQRQSSPPNRAESSFVTSFCNIVSYSYVEDEQILPASVEELDKKQSTTTFVACKDQLTIKKKVEVMAIFTPSPCHMIGSGSKKRKAVAYPEIIDLTKSPMY